MAGIITNPEARLNCRSRCIYPDRPNCHNCLEVLTLDPALTHGVRPGYYIESFHPSHPVAMPLEVELDEPADAAEGAIPQETEIAL